MNDLFDCLNVRSTTAHLRKQNALLAPYRSADDERFNWLQNVFLEHLKGWKSSVETNMDDKERICLSVQTFSGLKVTVTSVVAVTKFLLSEGFEFVLTERF
jgi:hypothetical protein